VEGCVKDFLTLKTPGKFTVGTDKPAASPWYSENDPTNGEGFESAVAYAIAQRLGFAPADVVWVTVKLDSVLAAGPKTFDITLKQVSMNEERRKAVDFSSGYYDVRQAVITYKKSPIAKAKKVADLKDAKLGAVVGSTSYSAAVSQIQPTKKVEILDNEKAALAELKQKNLDGIVVDLPNAFEMTANQLPDGVIIGQLPAVGQLEQFGVVLSKGSLLTDCISRAVDTLRQDGTLAIFADRWVTKRGAPELT